MKDSATFVMTGDIHMSNSLPYAKVVENGVTDRLLTQLLLLEFIGEKARKYKADGVMINGDFWDRALLDPITLAESTRGVANLAREFLVWILPGNHDAQSIRGVRFNVEALGEIAGVTVLREGRIKELGKPWLRFYACPYAPIEENRSTVASMREGLNPKKHNVLLFHNGVVGCKHLAWVCDDGIAADELCEGWSDVIAGHFHTRQKFGSCGRFLGAPMQHNFRDAGERRGIYAVKFQRNEDTRFIFIPTKLPEFHVVDGKWSIDDMPTARSGDYVRIQVRATNPDWHTIAPEVDETIEAMRKYGIHADRTHKPIYHHAERGIDADEMDGAGPVEMISRYVDSPDVVLGDLEPDILKTLGREFLDEAKAEK